MSQNTVDGSSQLSLFSLPPSPDPYHLTLFFSPFPSHSCASFSLSIDLSPPSLLLNKLSCPTYSPNPIPSTITPSPDFGANASLSSFWHGWPAISGMSHDVTISLTSPDRIAVTLAFNSLATPSLALTLGTWEGGNFIVIERGAHVGVSSPSDNTTVALSLFSRIQMITY